MKRRREILVLGATLLLAGCSSDTHSTDPTAESTKTPTAETTSSPTPMTTTSPVGTYQQRCSTGQLALTWGGRFSEPTGQHTLPLTLTNVSGTGCYLLGYPKVVLVDAGGQVLPLEYLNTGDQVVTPAVPTHVDLAPSAVAYVTVNKYRCDLQELMRATLVRLVPPGETAALETLITYNVSMAYCGSGDPGSIVHVSPVEPSLSATISH